jgi:lipoyl-dependent peroxiredoxin
MGPLRCARGLALPYKTPTKGGDEMATAERQARIVWDGPLRAGSGQLEFASSGIGTYPLTWASRVERPDGRTSPEELLAANHASCYAMALNATLSVGRHEPQRLDVTTTISLDPKDGGRFRISSSSELTATGVVPGLDQAGFQEAADQAEQACPISNSLRNNVQITVKATLES